MFVINQINARKEYLDIERIKNSLLNGSDVRVENSEVKIFKGSNGLDELSWSSAREDLY